MKTINIIWMVISLLTSDFPGFTNQSGSKKVPYNGIELTIENLSKKWLLDKYVVLGSNYPPEANEKKDFIYLQSNMSYHSISEGQAEKGGWKLLKGAKKLRLSNNAQGDQVEFHIKELTTKSLVLILIDPNDSDAQHVNIHFKSQSK